MVQLIIQQQKQIPCMILYWTSEQETSFLKNPNYEGANQMGFSGSSAPQPQTLRTGKDFQEGRLRGGERRGHLPCTQVWLHRGQGPTPPTPDGTPEEDTHTRLQRRDSEALYRICVERESDTVVLPH